MRFFDRQMIEQCQHVLRVERGRRLNRGLIIRLANAPVIKNNHLKVLYQAAR